MHWHSWDTLLTKKPVINSWTLKKGVTDSSPAVGTLRPGVMKLKDIQGNDNIVNRDEKEIIGDANPLHTGGFSINGRLYGFDLSANFNWSYGNDIYNANKIEFTQTGKYQYRNMIDIMFNIILVFLCSAIIVATTAYILTIFYNPLNGVDKTMNKTIIIS